MNCMKCGQEIEQAQVFCEECLTDMAKYPVRPGTVVQLPRREETPPAKKTHPRRRALSPEEQVKVLKKRLRLMTVIWLVTLALLAALVYPAAAYLFEDRGFLPGQNYSSITSNTTASTEAE